MLDSNAQLNSPVPPPVNTTPDSPLNPVIRTSPFRFVTPLIITVVLVLLVAGLLLLLKRFNLLPFFTSTSNPPTPTTITMWGINDKPETLQPLIDSFQQANPDLKVNYVQESLTDYRQRLTTATTRGQGPDLFVFHHSS
jgi:ABC-type glycerol-3-phosphate transport system substrate-binding protein